MINVPLLKNVKAAIIQQAERTGMGSWRGATFDRCQTTLCAAGWAAELAGGEWVMSDAEVLEAFLDDRPDDRFSALKVVPEDDPRDVDLTPSGPQIEAEYRARRVLGLSPDDADRLFYSGSCVLEVLDELIQEGEEEQARRE